MANERKVTTNHDEIRRWVEEHGGVPAARKDTLPGDRAGVLYIDFPGADDEREVGEMTWETWFKIFDQENLAFVYDDTMPTDQPHPFWQLVDRDTGEPVTT